MRYTYLIVDVSSLELVIIIYHKKQLDSLTKLTLIAIHFKKFYFLKIVNLYTPQAVNNIYLVSEIYLIVDVSSLKLFIIFYQEKQSDSLTKLTVAHHFYIKKCILFYFFIFLFFLNFFF